MAMLVMNIAIFALMAAFQSGSLALSRAGATSTGAVVGDRVMEVYRGLENKAIFLNAPASTGGSDVSGMPNGIPNSSSTWYAAYSANALAYGGVYYSYSTPANSPLWVTQSTTGAGYIPIPASSSAAIPSGLAIDPTKAVQKVTGPDGQSYTVFTYIIMVQPNASYGYLKQVTVMVFDPLNPTRIISRQSSLFDPTVAP
jgi:hypothetical protein